MCTGTDHYRAAERLLAGATSHQPPTGHLDRRELSAGRRGPRAARSRRSNRAERHHPPRD